MVLSRASFFACASCSNNVVQRVVQRAPLVQQLLQNRAALRRKPIETLLALVFLAPFARQQTLRLEPAKQRVQRAFVDLEAEVGERLAQRVAVVLRAQL